MPQTDREKARLLGPVKACIEEVSLASGKLVITTEFSVDGKLLSTRHLNPDGSDWITTNTYDVAGRLLETSTRKSGETSEETVRSYDEAGRLLLITNSVRSGDRTEFQYDGRGLKRSVQHFDARTLERFEEGKVAVAGSFWDAATHGVGVPIGGTITTTYDLNDQPTEAQVRDAEGEIVKHFVRTYDADGRVLEERAVSKNVARDFADRLVKNIPPEARDKMPSGEIDKINQTLAAVLGDEQVSTISYAYDTHGRETNVRKRNMAFESITSTTYNDQGEKVEERHDFVTNPAFVSGARDRLEKAGLAQNAVSDAPQPSQKPPEIPTARFDYDYDNYGNWTQQSVANASEPDGLTTMRSRKLTYFDVEGKV